MLRFEVPQNRRPRNYLARREQNRLFALIVGAGAVILLIGQLAGSQETAPSSEDSPARISAASRGRPAQEVEVDQQQLAGVRDNSHFRNEETDAWFYLLSLVEGVNFAVDSIPEVSYTQLVAQPHVYRGKRVRVAGEVERIEQVTPAPNDLGIEKLYRVLLKPQGKSPRPVTAYCRKLPEGWSVGEPLDNRVELVGYFFKNLSYARQDGMALTPVIVCESFSVLKSAPTTALPATTSPTAGSILATALAIAMAIVAIVIWRTSDRKEKSLDDAVRVRDSLRQLARESD